MQAVYSGLIKVGSAMAVGLISGCALVPIYQPPAPPVVDDKSGPAPKHIKDSGPAQDVDVSHVPNVKPKHEMVTLAGNKSPYTVLGKTYHIQFDTRGFQQTGGASWYGNKFHGRKTSNGETYDMYAMSAAHKTLPIPCYVEVTNLANNKKVTVRVNDRGPFHTGRVIDLSYTAAKRLGFVKKGTAKVKVRMVQTSPQPRAQVAAGSNSSAVSGGGAETTHAAKRTYLQLGAFSSLAGAKALQNKVRAVTNYPILIKGSASGQLHMVYVGPLLDNFHLLTLRQTLANKKLAEAHVVEF